ncbi:MAG: PepSY domain-containing protein [Planctomycetes bacterium]|nr:PepSY domain-containing protein [Planctomycetota bacterium]
MKPQVLHRKVHRLGAIAIALPLLCVLVSGILLQVKKELPWVQPPTQRGTPLAMELGLPRVLEILGRIPEAQVRSWSDVERIDVHPKRGILKAICANRWEVQLALADGAILHSAHRRSDLIESLHDGSFFGEAVKLGVFLPSALVLLVLWISGIYLWWLPHAARRRKARATQR